MKKFRFAYLMVLAAMAGVMAACSSDDSPNSNDQLPKEGMAEVTLHVSPAHSSAVTRWTDGNATDDEMMNIWVVVVTNTSDGSVEKCFACRPAAGTEREIDEVGRITKGAYTVYSFANISLTNVCNLLGLTAPASIPTIGSTPIEISVTGTVSHESVAAATVKVNGNGFNPTAANNGFGETGIPMSNVQTISNSETEKDLIVVRMLAKMEIQLYNETGSAVTVQSLTLSDLTYNPTLSDDPANLKLLPNLTSGANTMEDIHKDIQPNLNGAPVKVDYTYEVPSAKQTVATATYASGTPAQTLTFYVNESATPSNAEHLFYLTLKMSDTEFRYALISNNAANEWNYIARNDYRIIPVVLDDLKFEVIPYDFPPIGVYPCSVKEVDAANHVYDFEFHDYGHFHLLPTVTKGGEVVGFSATTPAGSGYKWTLIDNDFTHSWFTYAAFGDVEQAANPDDFYRTGTGSTTADGDDEGQTPVWYVNDGVAGPQWAPDAENYRPFVFGYIADPGAALASDKRVCHEMKIQVYNGTSAYRQMLYRFYMTLSMDQMLYSRGQTSMPRKRH